jgi:type II secretion system protein I
MPVANPRARAGSRSARASRHGFTLLELILALTILCGAVAALGEACRNGMRYAQYARDITQAQLLCESKLAEITAGVTPAEAQESVPFEATEDEAESEWLYSIEVTPLDDEGLIQVRVTVTKDVPASKRPVEFPLVRWMVDPSIETTEAATSAESGSTSSETGGT